MWERFPPLMQKAVVSALVAAGHDGLAEAGPVHLLLAMARDRESAADYLLRAAGADPKPLIDELATTSAAMAGADALPRSRAGRLSDDSMRLLRDAAAESERLGHSFVGTEHVLLALSSRADDPAGAALHRAGLTRAAADAAMRQWVDHARARKLGGFASHGARLPRPIAQVAQRLRKVACVPAVLWRSYTRKGLAHPGFATNPYPLYAWLREHEPVRRDPAAPVWVVTRYADVQTVLRDPGLRKDPFASQRLPRAVRDQLDVPASERARSSAESISMLFLDEPDHSRVRGQFARAFTPRTIADLRPRIEAITRARLDAAEAGGARGADLIPALAYPLPVMVIAELLGFPPADFERLKRWSDDLAVALAMRPSAAERARAAAAREELRVYFDGLVERLRERPSDSLVSRLLDVAREEGRAGLSREELFSNAVLLLAAGHETTTNLIGNGVLALLRHPDQLQRLRDDPSLVDRAVEELLRYDSPVQWVTRVTVEPLALTGGTVPGGQLVLASIGSANRDPGTFPDPDRLDLCRTGNRHLAFGQGPHFCLGAALARMEAEIAITALLERFPRLALATRRVKWHTGLTFRGVKALPVKW